MRNPCAGGLSALAILLWSGAAQAQNVYFGTLHAHSSYSDGSGTPAEAYSTAARNGMQFLMLSEHNHNAAEPRAGDRADGIQIADKPHLYAGTGANSLRSMAANATVNGRFVALWGQEFSTISAGNHVNVFEAPSVIGIPKGEFKQLVAWLDANPDSTGAAPLIQFNHPAWEPAHDNNYGRDDWGHDDAAWVTAMGAKAGLIEVLNGTATTPGNYLRTYSHEREYFEYLNLGFRLGPTAGHDNHYKNWGVSTYARTGVVAPALTKAALMTALRERATYASEDPNLKIIFRAAGGKLMGAVVDAPEQDDPLNLTIEISDPDEPNAHYHVELYRDVPGGPTTEAPAETYDFEGNSATPHQLDGLYFQTSGEYVLAKVTQVSVTDDDRTDRDRVWTAPIWFVSRDPAAGPGAPPPAATAPVAPALRLVGLLPDPAGPDFYQEAIVIKNVSGARMSLSGWKLRDEARNLWPLDPDRSVIPNEEVRLKRKKEFLSLNNGGDTVELLAPDGQVVQTFTYGPVAVDALVPVP